MSNGELPSKWFDGDTITDSKYSDGTQIHEQFASESDLPDASTRPDGQVVLVDNGASSTLYRNESGTWKDRTSVLRVGSNMSSSVLAQLIGELENDSNVTIYEDNFENMDSDTNLGSSRSSTTQSNNWSEILTDFNSLVALEHNNQKKNRLIMYTDSNGDYRISRVDLKNFSLVEDIVTIASADLPSRPTGVFTNGDRHYRLKLMMAELPSGDIMLTEYLNSEEDQSIEEEHAITYAAAVYDTSANKLSETSGVFEREYTSTDDEDSSDYRDWSIGNVSYGHTDSTSDAARTYLPAYWEHYDQGYSPSAEALDTVIVGIEYDESAGSFSTYHNRPGHNKGFTARSGTTGTTYQAGDRAYLWGNIWDEGKGYDTPENNVLYGYFDFSSFSFNAIRNYGGGTGRNGYDNVVRVMNHVLWETHTEEDNPDDVRYLTHGWYCENNQIYYNSSDPNNDGYERFETHGTPYGVEARFAYENESGNMVYDDKIAATVDRNSQNIQAFSELHTGKSTEAFQESGDWFPYDFDGSGVTRHWMSDSNLTFSASSLDISLDTSTVVGHLFAYHNTFRINDIFEDFQSMLDVSVEITNESGDTEALDTKAWVKYFDRPSSLDIQVSTSSFVLNTTSLNHYKLFYERADAP